MKFKKAFITLAASAMSLSTFAAPVLSNGNSLLSNSGITVSAASVGTVTQNGITYDLYDRVKINGVEKYNAAYISSCNVQSGCVTIPEGIYVNGSYYKIYKINYLAFNNSKISALDMHNAYSLTSIADSAFRSCNDLTEVILPPNLDKVTKVSNLFSLCRSLKAFVETPCANYTIIDGVLYNKDVTEILAYPPAKPDSDYTFPATVEKLNKDISSISFNNINNINKASDVTDEVLKKQTDIFFTIISNAKEHIITFNGEPVYTKDETNETEPVINPLLRDSFYEFFPDCTVISDAYAKDYAAYVVKNFTNENDSDFSKAVKLHDWLCDHTAYDPVIADLISKKQSISSNEKNQCDASAFLHYEKAHGLYEHDGFYTVCDGYARAYKLLMNAAGISCERVRGYKKEKDDYNHAWNIIRLNDKDDDVNNDKYYYIDVTWDSVGDYSNFMTFSEEDDNDHTNRFKNWSLVSHDAFDKLPEEVSYLEKMGDADKNGYLSVDDYKKIKELAANGGYVDEADLNGDSQITDEDADIMARYILIQRGDTNSDGIIDGNDVNAVRRNAAVFGKFNVDIIKSDINLDGIVDSADVEMINTMIGVKTKNIDNSEYAFIRNIVYHTFPDFELGDIDNSGNINFADAMMINNIIAADAAGNYDFYTEDQHTRADINYDGMVDSADLEMMNEYLSSAVSDNSVLFGQFLLENFMK